MRRREFIALLASVGISTPTLTHAQQGQRIPVIGFLHPGFTDPGSPVFDALGKGLRELGYQDGKNVKIESRWARGQPQALPQLTQELLKLHVDVLVPTARPSIEAAIAA